MAYVYILYMSKEHKFIHDAPNKKISSPIFPQKKVVLSLNI